MVNDILPGKTSAWQPPIPVVLSLSFHTDHDIPYLLENKFM